MSRRRIARLQSNVVVSNAFGYSSVPRDIWKGFFRTRRFGLSEIGLDGFPRFELSEQIDTPIYTALFCLLVKPQDVGSEALVHVFAYPP